MLIDGPLLSTPECFISCDCIEGHGNVYRIDFEQILCAHLGLKNAHTPATRFKTKTMCFRAYLRTYYYLVFDLDAPYLCPCAGHSKFRAQDYNLIKHNCNHFSDTFANLICGAGNRGQNCARRAKSLPLHVTTLLSLSPTRHPLKRGCPCAMILTSWSAIISCLDGV